MSGLRRFIVASAVIVAAIIIGSVPLQASHGQFYVLDGFGGIHAGGGAPSVSPGTPYFGFDIAQDIVYVPLGNASGAGDGVLVLDGFGGIHEGGALASDPVTPKTPYFGFNVARAITYRNVPPRVVGVAPETTGDIPNPGTTVYSVLSASIFAPDDGFLVVQGTVNLTCDTGDVVARTGVNVDSTTYPSSFANYYSVLRNCDDLAIGHTIRDIVTVHKTYPVAAGMHTAHLLLQFTSRNIGSLHWDSPHLTATFIDQDFEGGSAPDVVSIGPDEVR